MSLKALCVFLMFYCGMGDMGSVVARQKKKPEKIMLRVLKGGFAPADAYAVSKLRARGYKTGDVLGAVITKLRNPKFNGLVHRIGQLCAANIDEFHGMDAHEVIKRLQLESGVACDKTAIKVPGLGMVEHRTPKSLSYENMDEGEFHETARGICRWIASEYWPDLSAEAIESMAESFVEES